MTEIEVTQSTLIVRVKGVDKILALKSQLEIPLNHVVGAEIDPSVVEKWGHASLKEIRIQRSTLPIGSAHVCVAQHDVEYHLGLVALPLWKYLADSVSACRRQSSSRSRADRVRDSR